MRPHNRRISAIASLPRRATVTTAVLAVLAAFGVAVIVESAPAPSAARDTLGLMPVPDLAQGIPARRSPIPVASRTATATPKPSPVVRRVASAVSPRLPVPVPSASGSIHPRNPVAKPSAPTFTYSGPAMIGSSTGGSVSATQARFPNMQVVRFYYPQAPSVWGGAIAGVRSDQVIFVSFKYDVAATAAGGSDAAFAHVLQSWAASGRQIYWTWQHEADNPSKGISQAAYRAGWAHLLADAAAVHAPNLHSMSILMGVALNGSHGPVEGWYVPGVDVLGFDCYYLGTEGLAEQYAAAKHKRVAFPEFGAGVGGSSDPVSAAFAEQFISALDGNAIAAVWFNNYGNELSSHPQTLAVLRSAAG